MMPRSLQGRLLLLVLLVVGSVWLAAAAAIWFHTRSEIDELLDGHLAQAAALLIAQQGGHPDEDETIDAPSLHRYAPKVAFQVWHEGVLVLHSANAPLTPIAEHLEGFRTRQIAGVPWRVFATQGTERRTTVLVGEQAGTRDDILQAVTRTLLWPLAIALPLLAALVWWALRRGLAPLRTLGDTLAAREATAHDAIDIGHAPDEMRPMTEALNGLFARIGTLLEAERRFTADAAHELRTPIAAIRAQAQAAMLGSTDEARQHALHATLQGCDRASAVVEQLLTLARLDNSASHTADIDLVAVTRQVLADLAASALDKQQTLTLDADTACPMRGDAGLVGIVVRNLVDNAIRYSPRQALIRIRVAQGHDGATFKLEDSGPGMSAGDLERLGERFFRVLGSGQAGSGLGWSIVRRIAVVSGARVQVSRSDALGGFAVDVAWANSGARLIP